LFYKISRPLIIAPIAAQRQALFTERLRENHNQGVSTPLLLTQTF
jgi:hypothetical protein